MNSAVDTSRHAELNRDSIARPVTRFWDDVRADSIHGPTFEAVLGDRRAPHRPPMVPFWSTVTPGSRSFPGSVRPPGVIRGIARKRCRGHVGRPAGFDLIGSEMAHVGR